MSHLNASGPLGFTEDGQPLSRHRPVPQNSITNDSFQMGSTPILAATRPYDTNNAAVEQFLASDEPGNSRGPSRTVPGASATMSAPPLQPSEHSSFASPQAWQSNPAAPASITSTTPSLASTAQPHYQGAPFGAATASYVDPRSNWASPGASSGRPRTQAVPAPVLTTTISSSKPSAAPAPIITTFQKHTGRSPTTQYPSGFPAGGGGAGAPAASGSSPAQSHRTGSLNGQNRASDELRRSPYGSPHPALARHRSDRELTSLFASETNTNSGAGGRVSPMTAANRGRVSPSVLQSGGATTPRVGVATSHHSGGSRQSTSTTGGTKPQWLNAVERLRRSDSSNEPVLPLDQSKLGMAAHRARQQGVLTAAQLRSHEEQAGGNNNARDAGGQRQSSQAPHQQYQAPLQPLYASASSPAGRRSPSGYSGSQMGPLQAQEVMLHGSDSRSNGMGSEGSNWRKGHVRSVAANPTRGTVSAGGRYSNGGRVSPHSGGTPINRNNGGTAPTYSTMNADPFLGSRSYQAAPQTSRDGFQNFVHKTVALPTLFASEVHEAVTGTPMKRTDDKKKDKAGGDKSKKGKSGAATAAGGFGSNGGGDDDDGSSSGGGGGDKKGGTNNGKAKKNDHLEEDERDEQMLRSRDYNALHAIPWEQRRTMPMTGFGTRLFAVLASPRIWEKLDWTLRGAVLTILPTMVLSLEPATAPKFPMASSLAFTAFWITMPTFGSGLRELFIAIKGFCMGLVFVLITIAIDPPDWGIILCLFFFTLICAFVAEQSRKTIAYVLSSSLMQLISDRDATDYEYVGTYYKAIFVSLAFGTAAFLVPFIRWSSRAAKHYLKALGNALSIEVQGMTSSFWVRNSLERELNVVRLRQLRHTAEECMKKISVAISETGYEPHSGKFMSMLKVRFQFCQSIHNILGSMSQVIELLCDAPELTDTPMCNTFGNQIGDDLAVIASAMDSMVLKIVDFTRVVSMEEVFFFQQARERFQEALSRVRENVILTNEDYETDESDVFLGFFMFSIDELCETIASFHEDPKPRNNLVFWLTFWIRDIKSSIAAFRSLCLTSYYNRTITRRLKEAIKLSLCMALPVIFQVYALKNQPTSPMAGASIIAFMYNPTGSESFHYCSGRLLGTVLGSTASLLSVQIANGRRGVLYVFIALLSIIACYVQAAPEFYSLGNAMACSTISITTQYKDQNAAMLRIQQNCFAILIYFFIISVIWPMRGRTKVKMGLDVSLRCLRESAARLLCNLDMPYDAEEVVTDVSALLTEMRKKVSSQARFIPGAMEEPTLSSAEYPADAWKKVVYAETCIHATLAMMRFAYREFMSSRADASTELSVHWVVLHRIAPHAKDLSDLIYATIDLHLLSLSKTTIVPASQLTRLRRGMIESQQAILQTYIDTISHKIAGDDTDEEGEEYDDDNYYEDDGGSFNSSLPAPPPGHDDDDGSDDGTHKKKKKSSKGSSHGGSSGSDNGSDDGSDDADSDAEQQQQRKKKKKKTGYLGYKLTPEEAQALKDFITNGRVPGMANNSFSPSFGATNGSFSPTSFAAATATNNSLGATRTLASNLSMARVPQALMDSMAENSAWKTGALAQHGNNDGRMMALAGNDDGLAARLRKKHHLNKKDDDDKDKDKDNDENGESAEMMLSKNKSFGNNRSFDKNASFFLKNTSFLGKMFRRHKTDYQRDLDDDNDDDELTGSPAERQLTDAMSHRSSRGSSPRRQRHGASLSSVSGHDLYSPTSARACSTTRGAHGEDDDSSKHNDPLGKTVQGDDGDSGGGDAGGKSPTNPLDKNGPPKAQTDTAASSGSELPHILNDSDLKQDADNDGAHDKSRKDPSAFPLLSSISTAQANAGLKKTTATLEAAAASTTHAKGDEDDGHAVKSSNSSGGTGSTEKKIVSGKEQSSTPTKSTPDRERVKKSSSLADKHAESSKMSDSNALSPAQLLQSTLGAADGSQMPPNGPLGNISFFDPDSGEFILTNHDIHSLEAFLFGTRALVVYLNDLQKSILEMQHSSELAKKL